MKGIIELQLERFGTAPEALTHRSYDHSSTSSTHQKYPQHSKSRRALPIMGSNDTPPVHVPSSYHAICSLLLGTSGLLYTVTYVLMTRQSLRDRTYAMPFFSLAFNFACEIIFAPYVAESPQEKIIFVV